ncbi:hypothetical protein MATL_G00131490 [Megalops atlanticus]|uniref:Uncharacterized protein n=1 Tax=Megalops atlanticus TaxID=7932 RepID=A0A9D3PWJ5_MEGAT|nr:hypothetical protein MATL_G00131490 [Megalops atlanticus]
MTMNAHLFSASSTEPSVPPCEEYPTTNISPPDYEETPRDSGFPRHEELFLGSNYMESKYTGSRYDDNSSSICKEDLFECDHTHTEPSFQNRIPLWTQKNDRELAPSDYSVSSFTSTHKTKKPVIYPWMKKVRANAVDPGYSGGDNKSWQFAVV